MKNLRNKQPQTKEMSLTDEQLDVVKGGALFASPGIAPAGRSYTKATSEIRQVPTESISQPVLSAPVWKVWKVW